MNIPGIFSLSPPATEQSIGDVEGALKRALPADYRKFLRIADGFMLNSGIGLYGTAEIVERNATFEVATYAPGFIAIGDDSGGEAIMLSFDRPGVYLVPQGVMDPDCMMRLAASLDDWISGGCLTRMAGADAVAG